MLVRGGDRPTPYVIIWNAVFSVALLEGSGVVVLPMEKGQFKSLTDIVFGLAISIGGIGFITSIPRSSADIFSGMAWFALGFLILIALWVNYTRVIDETEIESPGDMILNVLLLLCVSLEPIVLNIISALSSNSAPQVQPGLLDFSTTIYAVDVGSMLLIFSLLYHWVVQDKIKAGLYQQMMEFRHLRNIRVLEGGIFFLSVLPFFWNDVVNGIQLRYIIWLFAVMPAMLIWFHNYRVHSSKPVKK